MLVISVEKALLYQDDNRGYARYRIDFENLNPQEKYVLGWRSPRYPTVEFHEYLDRITDFEKGWVREIYQENVAVTQAFTVKLYRKGLRPDEMWLLEEQNYLGIPLD